MGVPYSTVELRAYDRDGTTLRGSFQMAQGAAWVDELGGGGSASLAAPLVQQVLATTPGLLEDSIIKIAADLEGDPGSLTEIPFFFLGEGGQWTLVGDAEEAGRQRVLQCRGPLGMFDDTTVYPEGGWEAHSGDDRAFGWMSAITEHSFDTSQWDGTINATKWKDVGSTSDRYKKPRKWPDKNAAWVGCGNKPKQYFRAKIVVTENTPVKIFCAADEHIRVYLDSRLIIKGNSDETGYTKLRHKSVVLGPGVHTLAFKYTKEYERFASWGLATDYSDADKAILTVLTVNEHGHLKKVLRRTSDNTNVWLACQRDDDDDPPAWTAAGIVRQLVKEARLRDVDAMDAITFNFDKNDDTDGVAWPDVTEKKWSVGTSLQQVLADLGVHVDWDLVTDPDDGLVFNAYKSQGSDLSEAVALTVGGAGAQRHLLSYTIGTQPIVANALLVRSANRWQERTDDTSIATYGRREGFLKLGKALSRTQARRRADRVLENHAVPLETHTAEIVATDGCVPYKDFGKGDVIMGLDRDLSPTPLRVVSISGQVPDSGPLRFTLELQAA